MNNKSHYHFISGGENWSMPGLNDEHTYMFLINPVFDLLTDDKIQVVKLSDIAHLPLLKSEQKLKRYKKADVEYPGILVTGLKNEGGKLFRMIDGRNRITKLKNANITHSEFYVLDFNDIKVFLPTDPTYLRASTMTESDKYLRDNNLIVKEV